MSRIHAADLQLQSPCRRSWASQELALAKRGPRAFVGGGFMPVGIGVVSALALLDIQ